MIISLALLLVVLWQQPTYDRVSFLDVGQGDAILFQDDTQQVLIDGGPGATVLQRLGEEMPPFDRTIEVVMLTHPQQDHMEGLLHILERYDVELVLLPAVSHTSQLQAAWLDMITDQHIPYRFAWAGQRMQVGDIAVQLLGPLDTAEAHAATRSDINNASIVTRVDYHDMSFLLTGDAEERVENLLVSSETHEQLDVDVLKAGHHGSNTSTHEALLTATTPEAIVISVGEDNRYKHPHPAVLERFSGVPLWRTDEHGSVRFLWTENEWVLATAQ